MSTILKSKMYTVKANLLVECAKAMRRRTSKDHFVLGGIMSIITELLFCTYYTDDVTDEYCNYSDTTVVSNRIPTKYVEVARMVIWYRNKFAYEFGSEEYFELYEQVIANMQEITEMCHHIGGVPTMSEKRALIELLDIDEESLYDSVLAKFMEYGPIGFRQLCDKLQRRANSKLGNMLKQAEG